MALNKTPQLIIKGKHSDPQFDKFVTGSTVVVDFGSVNEQVIGDLTQVDFHSLYPAAMTCECYLCDSFVSIAGDSAPDVNTVLDECPQCKALGLKYDPVELQLNLIGDRESLYGLEDTEVGFGMIFARIIQIRAARPDIPVKLLGFTNLQASFIEEMMTNTWPEPREWYNIFDQADYTKALVVNGVVHPDLLVRLISYGVYTNQLVDCLVDTKEMLLLCPTLVGFVRVVPFHLGLDRVLVSSLPVGDRPATFFFGPFYECLSMLHPPGDQRYEYSGFDKFAVGWFNAFFKPVVASVAMWEEGRKWHIFIRMPLNMPYMVFEMCSEYFHPDDQCLYSHVELLLSAGDNHIVMSEYAELREASATRPEPRKVMNRGIMIYSEEYDDFVTEVEPRCYHNLTPPSLVSLALVACAANYADLRPFRERCVQHGNTLLTDDMVASIESDRKLRGLRVRTLLDDYNWGEDEPGEVNPVLEPNVYTIIPGVYVRAPDQ